MYSSLATPTATRAVLARHGLTTKHHLGQNFLVNDAIIGKIVELAQLRDDDIVLEVGPGIGTLTCAMLPRTRAVVSVEADRELKSVLAETLAQDSDHFALVMGDALRVQYGDIKTALMPYTAGAMPTAFVANLPYQVAATLILKYIQTFDTLERICVMVQAEVADRIGAQPGSKTYGAYTAKLNLYGRVTGRFEVGPANFMPPPHVDSAVVRIDVCPFEFEGRVLTADELSFTAQVIDAAFAQRRKTIRNSMSSNGFAKDILDTAFEKLDIVGTVRAETLSTIDFVRLSCILKSLMS